MHIKALEGAAEKGQAESAAVHRKILREGSEVIAKSFLGKLEKQLFKERLERKLESQYQ